MKSEFTHLSLETIRYSLVWEDSQTVDELLDICADDCVLMITSAGCNILNALLKNPKEVTAIDLNANQNNFLELKKHIILNHDFKIYRGLYGLDGINAVALAVSEIKKTLPANALEYWSHFFESHPKGMLTAGKLERYITAFFPTLPVKVQEDLLYLVSIENVEDQFSFFSQHIDCSVFKPLFMDYFDDANLSEGRDPRLFKYAEASGASVFYNRLITQLKSFLVKDNFYFRFFFFGAENIPEEVLPPCMQEKNFENLRTQLHKLTLVKGEAIEYLLSDQGFKFNKISLSNIFEYTSHYEFAGVLKKLSNYASNGASILFWNLLNIQGQPTPALSQNIVITQHSLSAKACFYFKDVVKMIVKR